MNDSPVSKTAIRVACVLAVLIAAGISQFKGGISGAGVAAFLITAVVIGALLFRRYAYRDGALATIATGEQGFTPTYLVPGTLCLGVGLGFIAGIVYAPVGVALIAASIAGIRVSR